MRAALVSRRFLATLVLALAFVGGAGAASKLHAEDAPLPAPPGFNVHRVLQNPAGHVFWRGGAPRIDTLDALARSAAARGGTVTLIDLRHPPSADDLSGKGGRLSPDGEAARGAQKGFRYLSISALDKEFNARVDEALARGDVYLHCMYGVNRTGFAVARYARKHRAKVAREGLGKNDWTQGDAFEVRLEATGKGK